MRHLCHPVLGLNHALCPDVPDRKPRHDVRQSQVSHLHVSEAYCMLLYLNLAILGYPQASCRLSCLMPVAFARHAACTPSLASQSKHWAKDLRFGKPTCHWLSSCSCLYGLLPSFLIGMVLSWVRLQWTTRRALDAFRWGVLQPPFGVSWAPPLPALSRPALLLCLAATNHPCT